MSKWYVPYDTTTIIQQQFLTMLAITCVNSIVHNTILIELIIANFKLNFMKLSHSARPRKRIEVVSFTHTLMHLSSIYELINVNR